LSAIRTPMDLPLIDNYHQLFLDNIPLMDVRAPIEFEQGTLPNSVNLPLINDDERQAIGICYKEMGQQHAIELGHELVQGEVKEQRVKRWVEYIQQYPHGALYCFRGGMRSKITQQWIYEKTGIAYPRIKGGYKALRRFLLEELETSTATMQPFVLSGRTGSGKTVLLQHFEQSVDLEKLYHHRGSAFGKRIDPQPGQVDIENTLSIALLNLRNRDINRYLLEDEARAIGSRRLPNNLIDAMQHAPLLVLEIDIETRVNNIFQEYILESLNDYRDKLGEQDGFQAWSENLLNALNNIQRRLGGSHYRDIQSIMSYAIDRHRLANEPEHHKTWIYHLLAGYYDPMYDYQLGKKTGRIIFRGDHSSVTDYLSTQHGIR